MPIFSSPFTITTNSGIIGGTPGNQQIAVQNVSLGNLSPYLFGIATEGGNVPGSNDYAPFLNSSFQAQYRSQNFRLFRHNAAGSTPAWVQDSTTEPNNVENWFTGSKTFWTPATGPTDYTKQMVTMTLGGSEGNYVPTASDCQAVANLFKARGQECFVWQIINEPSLGFGAYINAFNTCYNTLKGINPNYWVGGPVVNYATNDSYMSALASNSNKPDFVDWHVYYDGNSGNQAYFNAVTTGGNAPGSGVGEWLGFVKGYFPNTPIYLSEYNMVDTASEPLMGQSDGGVWVSLFLGNLLRAAGPLAWGAAIWEQCANGDYKIVANDGSIVYPQGLVLGKLGRAMGGTQMQITNGANIPNSLYCFASATANGNWSVWITNAATSGSAQPLGIVGLGGTSYMYWQLDPNNFNPPMQLVNQPMSGLLSLSIPPRSVVVITSNAT